jgi:hypothetical protein
MFKSIYYANYYKKPGCYIIIDNDFKQKSEENITSEIEAVIQIYSQRSLNVSKNIFLYLKYTAEINGTSIEREIEREIDWNYRYASNIRKYIKEVEKYLSLI